MKEVHSLCSLIGHLDSKRHWNVWNQLIVQQLVKCHEHGTNRKHMFLTEGIS